MLQMDRLRMRGQPCLHWQRLQGLHSGRDGVEAIAGPEGGLSKLIFRSVICDR